MQCNERAMFCPFWFWFSFELEALEAMRVEGTPFHVVRRHENATRLRVNRFFMRQRASDVNYIQMAVRRESRRFHCVTRSARDAIASL